MSQDYYMLKVICNAVPTLVFLVFFLVLYKEQEEYNNYYQTSCYIVNTTYPTDITQYNQGLYWIECSCGRRCRSVSPCLSIYTDDNDLPILESYDDKNAACTFYQSPCIGNENPLILFDKMARYIAIGQDYQNSTVSCYKNKNNPDTEPIYLKLKDVSTALYIISGIFGFFMLINVYLVIRLFWFNEDTKKKNKIIISHKIVPSN